MTALKISWPINKMYTHYRKRVRFKEKKLSFTLNFLCCQGEVMTVVSSPTFTAVD